MVNGNAQLEKIQPQHQTTTCINLLSLIQLNLDIRFSFLNQADPQNCNIHQLSKIIIIPQLTTNPQISSSLSYGLYNSNLFILTPSNKYPIVQQFFYSQQMEDNSQLSMKEFQILKELGSGSFGKVKLVKKKDSQTLYALKTVLLNRLNQKQKDGALNQVRLLASISIPTVIKYEGSFFNNQTHQLCVLMEYADGGDLQNKIVQRQNTNPGVGFEEKFIWRVAYQILQGLKSLHKNNIIHRDIKSANIFFVKGVAKLGDLNVSKIAEDGFCSTQTGTPYYTSPQVWSGQKYGNKCDIWSLGCLIYELCTLKVPFKASDFPSLFRKITKGEYSEIPSKYSQKMRRLVHMCLTVEEEMRPSATELLENSMFEKIDREGQSVKGGEINIVQSIKCPKVLKFLNTRLPKAKNDKSQIGSKKTVNFNSKADIQVNEESKQNGQYRRIRSQKAIQWEQQSCKAPRQVKFVVNKPKQQVSQKQISNGLVFSTKKIRMKPTSTKLIMGIAQ